VVRTLVCLSTYLFPTGSSFKYGDFFFDIRFRSTIQAPENLILNFSNFVFFFFGIPTSWVPPLRAGLRTSSHEGGKWLLPLYLVLFFFLCNKIKVSTDDHPNNICGVHQVFSSRKRQSLLLPLFTRRKEPRGSFVSDFL